MFSLLTKGSPNEGLLICDFEFCEFDVSCTIFSNFVEIGEAASDFDWDLEFGKFWLADNVKDEVLFNGDVADTDVKVTLAEFIDDDANKRLVNELFDGLEFDFEVIIDDEIVWSGWSTGVRLEIVFSFFAFASNFPI